MKLELSQKQTMNVMMTTEMRQAISLLQYSALDLHAYVQEVALENPLLQVEEPPFHGGYFNTLEADPAEFWQEREKPWRDMLTEEVLWMIQSTQMKNVMHDIILNLNDRGYLPVAVDEIVHRNGTSRKVVEDAIEQLKQFEGRGFGCATVQEYLLQQVARQSSPSLRIYTMIQHHYQSVLERDRDALHKNAKMSYEEIDRVYHWLQSITPYPSFGYEKEKVAYVVPELTVKKQQDTWKISSIDNLLPSIEMDVSLMTSTDDEEANNYLSRCHNQALWLLRSLEKRKATIVRITEAIVRRQVDFLENGYLKPMTLRELAEDIGVHESTVSRAIANKSIQTPRGTIDLKSFFTSKLKKESGDDVSSSYVKAAIRLLVEDEVRGQPLSDQKIANRLNEHQRISISRRTVAKYRESINIPSSSKRKKLAFQPAFTM
ncbi:RNA polymerase factor sigma-54 [Halobacillus locisalis]|uniref:RNA polymerase factor sigma-54 n=1 Tax=Halobacillus locisalis TaxID=220753 RepID=A0A838CSP5_9BACI|nr:RNA polymerase factor sigma-54 [Halobacillus locisalis]MBA2174964.1 RNA polymerase factor sigma-54 [Halobacillus locisalis]